MSAGPRLPEASSRSETNTATVEASGSSGLTSRTNGGSGHIARGVQGDAAEGTVHRTAVGGRRYRRGDARGFMIRRLLMVADVAALAIAFVLVELYGGFDRAPGNSIALDFLLLAGSAPIWVLLARAHDLYHVDTRHADHRTADEVAPVLQLTTLWSWGVLLIASVTGLLEFSLPALFLFWILAFLLVLSLRALVRTWARRRTWYLQNALVLGNAAEARGLAEKILRHPEYGINVVACLELGGDGVEDQGGVERAERASALGHIPFIRGDLDVATLADELDVDRIVLGSSVGALAERAELVSELSQLPLHLDVVPGWGEVMGSRLALHEMEGMPLLTFPSAHLPRSSLLMKRAVDIAGAACGLAAISPLLAICALAIKLDSPGPVLFRQSRIGREGRRFELLKFRSMGEDAEALRDEVARLTIHGGGTDEGIFKVAQDPRVTRVGRLMRRFSIDELPQLFNVSRGDMSLVGPRPLPEIEHERIAGRHRRRVDLLPGLTGLWQVHGRSDIPFEGMVDLDYLYVTNWSLWVDLKLLMRTVGVVVRGQGAY